MAEADRLRRPPRHGLHVGRRRLDLGGWRCHLRVDPGRSPSALGSALYVFLFVALLEETLYRGFLFQRFVDGAGAWIAQLAMGVLFAAAHWGNPGMEGAAMVWATVDTAAGAIMLGLAYLRTRSLALPIGLHLGWNWAQGSVLGFGVSGYDQAGWLRPVFQGKPEWLTGGAFGPEASVFAVVADLALVALLWRWKGSASGQLHRHVRQCDPVGETEGARHLPVHTFPCSTRRLYR